MTSLADGRLDEEGLRGALARTLGCPAHRIVVVKRERLKADVQRLRLEVLGAPRAVIAKRLAPEIAVRNRLVLERWLPSEGLAELAAPLLGILPEARATWLVFADLGARTLAAGALDGARLEAALACIARLHRTFAEHALLGEVRLWGGELGTPFHDANLRDAARAVAALGEQRKTEREPRELCARLVERLHALQADSARRARVLERAGGPETLLHGDLWLANFVELEGGVDPAGAAGPRLRLIDWDHAGVGSPLYDVSTFLYRLEPGGRRAAWAAYRAAFGAGAWRFPDEEELALLCETAEHARIANRLIWPALAALRGEYDTALEELATVEGWFDDLRPLLP